METRLVQMDIVAEVETPAHIIHISNVLETICTGTILVEISKTAHTAQMDALEIIARTTLTEI